MIGAEPGVRLRRGAIHMPGAYIRALIRTQNRMRAAIDAIQDGIEPMLLQ